LSFVPCSSIPSRTYSSFLLACWIVLCQTFTTNYTFFQGGVLFQVLLYLFRCRVICLARAALPGWYSRCRHPRMRA
jgi:hypothetical protein